MENNLKQKIDSFKKQESAKTIFYALAVVCMESFLVFWGWNTMENSFGFTHLSYLDVLSIMVGVRALCMLLIDPYTTK
jgi:hypothetical protein